MNGFKMMAESYRKLVEQGKFTEEQAKRNIEIYEFLATCDTDDFCTMIDSSAFNDIIRGFVKLAVKKADLDQKSQEKVIDQLRWLFDEKTAKEILDQK